ncbi:MAG: hypothetical protein UHS49_01630, partial [Faecalimonas sp.]|nr:hypothetical protein [Faecalimonas sp.]
MDDLISRQAAIDEFGLSEKTRKYGGRRIMTPDCNTCRWFIPIPMRILTKAEAEMVRNGIYIERRQCIWNVCRYENKEKNH